MSNSPHPPPLVRQPLVETTTILPRHLQISSCFPASDHNSVMTTTTATIVSPSTQVLPTDPSCHGNRGVVDLTNDNDIIDLTSPTPASGIRSIPPPLISDTSSDQLCRPSCRYATTHTSPDVLCIEDSSVKRKIKSRIRKPHKTKTPYTIETSLPDAHIGKDKSGIKCPVCLESSTQFEKSGSKLVSTICGHVFCSQCLRNSITTMHKCPTCRRKLTLKQYHNLFL